MNCKKAEELFYKFLDGTIDSSEKNALELHTKSCDYCKEELAAYMDLGFQFDMDVEQNADLYEEIGSLDKTLASLCLAEDHFSIPENFESMVIEKIQFEKAKAHDNAPSFETILCSLMASMSVLIGFLVVLFSAKPEILEFILDIPYITKVSQRLNLISDALSKATQTITGPISQATTSLSVLLSSYNYVLLIIAFLLLLMVVNRKNKLVGQILYQVRN